MNLSFKSFLCVSAVTLTLGLNTTSFAAKPASENVYFDVPNNLLPNSIPSPTVDLAALPGYPNDPTRLTLVGRLYLPDPAIWGDGPYPSVIILHGSGGLWSNDIIANGPLLHLKEWANLLSDMGFLCLLPDSFNPRGIPENFQSKRPSHDPMDDDALCSPNYERPKDVIAALTYLTTRGDVDKENVGLMGFSHGSQAGLNAILDPSIDLSPYTVNYIDQNDQTIDLMVDSPVRIPDDLPFPKVCIFYYPGCGHFGYHGQASSIAANRYMPDQRTQVLMYHGTDDFLMDVDDINANPLTGDLFPIKFVLSSAQHAAGLGIDNPFVHHLIFDKAEHSFDRETIEPEMNWNTNQEDEDEKAKRLARDETLKWLQFSLMPADLKIEEDPNNPPDLEVNWFGIEGVDYQLQHNDDLGMWINDGNITAGADTMIHTPISLFMSGKVFYRLSYEPQSPPIAAPENTGFFREYNDFQY